MEQVKVYDHAGNEFLAPNPEAAEKAVESGQYFFERPDESLADSLGLQPVVPVVADDAVKVQRDGTDRLYVFDKKGKRHSMWAVDAKECVKSGQYFWTPPAQADEDPSSESGQPTQAATTKSGTSRRGGRTK